MWSFLGKRRRSKLADDESGAVTVDWVVLTAAVVIAFYFSSAPIFRQVRATLDDTGTLVKSTITIFMGG